MSPIKPQKIKKNMTPEDKELEKKLHGLLEVVKDFYVKNNLDIYDLMYFYAIGISGVVSQKEEFDYEKFVIQIKNMVKIIKNEENHS